MAKKWLRIFSLNRIIVPELDLNFVKCADGKSSHNDERLPLCAGDHEEAFPEATVDADCQRCPHAASIPLWYVSDNCQRS